MISTILFDLSEVYLGGMYGIDEKISKITGKELPYNSLHRQPEAQDFFHGKLVKTNFGRN